MERLFFPLNDGPQVLQEIFYSLSSSKSLIDSILGLDKWLIIFSSCTSFTQIESPMIAYLSSDIYYLTR